MSFESNEIGVFAYVLTFLSFLAAIILTFPIYFFEARNLFLLVIDVRLGLKELSGVLKSKIIDDDGVE